MNNILLFILTSNTSSPYLQRHQVEWVLDDMGCCECARDEALSQAQRQPVQYLVTKQGRARPPQTPSHAHSVKG